MKDTCPPLPAWVDIPDPNIKPMPNEFIEPCYFCGEKGDGKLHVKGKLLCSACYDELIAKGFAVMEQEKKDSQIDS